MTSDEELKALIPDFTTMPTNLDAYFSGDVGELNGSIIGYPRRLIYKGQFLDATRFSHNNAGWGKSAGWTDVPPATRHVVRGSNLIGLGLKASTGPGDFLGLPVGSIIKDIHEEWWRLIHKDVSSSRMTLANCADPSNIFDRVNPNLGIRRCLKRFNGFSLSQKKWSPQIILPQETAHVELAKKVMEGYALHGNSPSLLKAYMKSINYMWNGEMPENILAVAPYAESDWDAFEGLCE
jgi:hypothetical protein